MPRLRAPSRTVVAAMAVVAVVGVTGGVVAATRTGSSPHHSHQSTAPGVDPSAGATVELLGLRHGLLRWDRPAKLVVSAGHLSAVTVTSSDGNPVAGVLSADGSEWSSTGRLIPRTRYVARAVLSDDAVRTLHFHTTDSTKHLTAVLSPGDGDTVGVGSPVIVTFSRPVPDAKRAMVERRLAVSTNPDVIGAWHWLTAQEVYWRPPTYWKSGTRVTVSSDLDKLYFGDGVWGSGQHQTSFRIGHSHISRVDGARHEMYVYDNGHLVKTFPISAGRTQYPTKSGVHITFEKSQVVTMDSATVGIPRNSPDGYYEKVYWDVRISYGGAFVHAAPWSVAEQGIANVSHGCVNISTENAIWFYNFSLRGDIVDVYNTGAPPDTYDPGMADWNMSWKQWLAGDAAPTAAAKALHPPMPRSLEPPAPGTSTKKSGSPSHHTSPSPTPSASTSPRRATH